MAITDHAAFRQPNQRDLKVWRYMDFTKFAAMLSKKDLFFCCSARLEDPFEGSYPEFNVAMRSSVYKDLSFDQKTIMFSEMSGLSRNVREWTFVNCWHGNETESAAMWKLYAKTSEAIAIESDYSTLAGVLPDTVYLGLITYIDYETQWLPEGNTFYPFVHKRKSFEHEREVRALLSDTGHYIASEEHDFASDRTLAPGQPAGRR